MARCHGSTKAGERCKRSVPDGTMYCAAHADQAEPKPGLEPESPRSEDRGPLDTVVALAAAAVVVMAVLTVRRFFRFL